MSRRTFARAAGLVAAVVGSQSPALAQGPNPWRGETAAVPTAPAPRPVVPAQRQFVVGLELTPAHGLTGTVQFRVAPTPPPTHARAVCVDLDPPTGPCPAAGPQAAQARTATTDAKPVAANGVEDLVPSTAGQAATATGREAQALATPRYLDRYPAYFPSDPVFPLPRELAALTDHEKVAGPAEPVVVVVGSGRAATRVMPAPAPLPGTRPTPQPLPVIIQAGFKVERAAPPAIPPAVE